MHNFHLLVVAPSCIFIAPYLANALNINFSRTEEVYRIDRISKVAIKFTSATYKFAAFLCSAGKNYKMRLGFYDIEKPASLRKIDSYA